ncbi:MAG: amidase [Candidatus Izimaplasma sp.]|nr:amidase [Candidatus Izimaplasma bacterium]
MENKEYDILTLQTLLSNTKITSKDLVDFYLKKIQKQDPHLNTLADLNQAAYKEAEALDLERQTDGPRGLMHGIPIVIKDNIFTKGSMRTTVGSYAFHNFYAPFDAFLIKQLKKAGAIILAKANLSEFAYFMSMHKMPSGYGSMHGQVVHPYDKEIDPLGSSTGPAVSVAANLAPVSIGTETNGSLMSPAQQNSIVSIKPTVGLVSRHGIVPISFQQDSAGPMSRSVIDSAIVLDAIKGRDENDSATWSIQNKTNSYKDACEKSPKGLKVGIINFKNYGFNDEEQAIIEEAKQKLESQGVIFKMIDYTYDLPNNIIALTHHFKHDLNAFLATIKDVSPVKSLLDLIRFNNVHSRRCLKYGQTHFLQAQATSGTLKDPEYLENLFQSKKALSNYTDLFKKHDIDVLLSTKITGYPAVGGLPSLIVPAKALTDKSPRSLIFVGEKWQEATLFSLAHHYEQATKHRIKPNLE